MTAAARFPEGHEVQLLAGDRPDRFRARRLLVEILAICGRHALVRSAPGTRWIPTDHLQKG